MFYFEPTIRRDEHHGALNTQYIFHSYSKLEGALSQKRKSLIWTKAPAIAVRKQLFSQKKPETFGNMKTLNMRLQQ